MRERFSTCCMKALTKASHFSILLQVWCCVFALCVPFFADARLTDGSIECDLMLLSSSSASA